MSGQIFSSMKYIVTWKNCDKEATLGARTFEDFHDARCYATRREHLPGITIEKVYTVIEVENISKKVWLLIN